MSNHQHVKEEIVADTGNNFPASGTGGRDGTRPQMELITTVGKQLGGEITVLKDPTWIAARDNIIQFVVQQYVTEGVVPPTEEELRQAQTDYLDYMIATSAPMDWQGFAADRKPGETPLDRLYVMLTTEYAVEQALPNPLEDTFSTGRQDR